MKDPKLSSISEDGEGRHEEQSVSRPEESKEDEESLTGAASTTTDDDASTVWFREDERWELTWPIWHMLSRSERKNLAQKHGYKTIGEFEEFMTLQRAVGDSSQPYDNNLAYAAETATITDASTKRGDEENRKPTVKQAEDDDDDDSCDEELQEQFESEQRLAAAEDLSQEDLLAVGGQILMLPEEMLHRVFDWLPVDTYATLAAVSPHWKSFTRTEHVYKRLCERLYLNQSKRRALHVSRFGNSYRTMLEKRPRVRAGGGVYVMKYARVKKIQRDMWTEVRRVCSNFGCKKV